MPAASLNEETRLLLCALALLARWRLATAGFDRTVTRPAAQASLNFMHRGATTTHASRLGTTRRGSKGPSRGSLRVPTPPRTQGVSDGTVALDPRPWPALASSIATAQRARPGGAPRSRGRRRSALEARQRGARRVIRAPGDEHELAVGVAGRAGGGGR